MIWGFANKNGCNLHSSLTATAATEAGLVSLSNPFC